MQRETQPAAPYARNAMAYVLAGGRGSRLMELTDRRAKPAVYFAGKSRIIDFALTNCMHSGLRKITVFTQFNSLSLQNHLRDGWSIFNTDLGEFVAAVSPPINDHLDSLSRHGFVLVDDVRDTKRFVTPHLPPPARGQVLNRYAPLKRSYRPSEFERH